MIQEKKSSLNSIFISILLFLISLFAYIILKTKGFGSLNYVFDNLLNPYINTLENILVILNEQSPFKQKESVKFL